MRVSTGVMVLLAALLLVISAKDKSEIDFLGDARFRFGMELTAADERLADKPDQWDVLYRIDTPRTSEFACTYRERELYLVRFYQGECYFIEHRAELALDRVQDVFDHYAGLYGTTSEATQSRDSRLLYARWMLKDRDIELTAHQRDGGAYIMTHQEFDPVLLGEALHVRETELENSGTLEIDPLTGKPRMATHEAGDAGGESDEAADEDREAEDQENAGDDEEPEQDPPPEEEEDTDWY